MDLELIVEFESFLAEHIKTHGNKGKGSVSYLSTTICDELIQLMANKVLQKIVHKTKASKYFSISTDSTPNLSHVDQLTFVIRYVSENGIPKEQFIKFLPNCGHKSENLANCVFDTLQGLGLVYKIVVDSRMTMRAICPEYIRDFKPASEMSILLLIMSHVLHIH